MSKTRIAPTPSGFLHAGNAFNFLVTDRLAKGMGARLVLRIDDLDAERVRPEYVEDVFRSLEWLGVRVDEGPSGPQALHASWSQQLRIPRYNVAVEQLRTADALYPCSCSRTHMEPLSRAGHDCRIRPMHNAPRGTPWRLRIPEPGMVPVTALDDQVEWMDLPSLMPDPVIVQRASERPAYQIASSVDDLEMGITFIVRGEDLRPSTACQAFMARILEKEAFGAIRFHHHPLLRDTDGAKLSKSAGSTSLRAMRESGQDPGALISAAYRYVDTLALDLSL